MKTNSLSPLLVLLAACCAVLATPDVSRNDTVSLVAGESVKVRVHFRGLNVVFSSCDRSSCTKLAVLSDGAVGYSNVTECTPRCRATKIGDIGEALQAGEHYVFVVERQPQQLTVWLETRPEKRVPVPVNEASDLLTVAVVPARTGSVEFFGRTSVKPEPPRSTGGLQVSEPAAPGINGRQHQPIEEVQPMDVPQVPPYLKHQIKEMLRTLIDERLAACGMQCSAPKTLP